MNLNGLLTDGTYMVLQPEDYSTILSHIKDAEIVFVGEDRHWIPTLIDFTFGLGIHLADEIAMKVFALEGLYEYHPFMEEASRLAASVHEFDERVVRYNRPRPESERILMTAIDIAHSIAMPSLRYAAIDYMFHLAHLSASWKATQDILKTCSVLFTVTNAPDTHKDLDQVQEVFERYQDSFSANDWDNIRFSFALFHESLEYHVQIGKYASNAEIPIEIRELRGKGFRQTIERAYVKAQRRSSRLYCYVGDVHAFKAPVTQIVEERMDKWPPALWPEAMYFDQMHEATNGKVYSLLLRTLISHRHGETNYIPKGDLDDVVFERMGSANLMYVDLDRIAELHGPGSQVSMYFAPEGPIADAVVFFREV